MAVRSNIVTVTNQPTPVGAVEDVDYDQTRRDVAIQNIGDTTVYLGGQDVTAATGYPLGIGAGLTLEGVHPTSLPHVITASGTGSIAVLEVGV